MNKLVIGLIITLILSLSLNGYVLFVQPISKDIQSKLDDYDDTILELENIKLSKDSIIDSLLLIPNVNTTIIKNIIYENVSQQYPDGNTINNIDTLVQLWTDLSEE